MDGRKNRRAGTWPMGQVCGYNATSGFNCSAEAEVTELSWSVGAEWGKNEIMPLKLTKGYSRNLKLENVGEILYVKIWWFAKISLERLKANLCGLNFNLTYMF